MGVWLLHIFFSHHYDFSTLSRLKLTMENRYGLLRQSSGVWRSLRDGDFEEEDVWSVLKDNRTTTDHHSTMNTKNSPSSSSLSVARHVPTAARMIPKATSGGGGGGGDSSSSSVSSNHEGKILQQSAPVNIPNWHNIYRHKSKISSKNGSWRDDYDDEDDGAEDEEGENDDDDDEDDCYDNDEYGHKLPPHEFIARRLAKSHISSFSVFEGVGRTLKGRDLSKVRNAVLTKTGFLESL